MYRDRELIVGIEKRALSRDEFRGPRSDFVRQVALVTTTTDPHPHNFNLRISFSDIFSEKVGILRRPTVARMHYFAIVMSKPRLTAMHHYYSLSRKEALGFETVGHVHLFATDGDRFNSCQVIYSQFGLAIHQNDHQARRRFVEWAQNEIAVVPDFHKRILFSDEAHFWLNGYVNKQNCRSWSEANPQVYVETPLHLEKLTVWCALWAGGILLQKR
ncbi:uncharacterized protein TNCV_1311031 [Trichonephila clavipes]|nr:uncharacterized protein TNCV_1311031 [Trichonephila clavipes]